MLNSKWSSKGMPDLDDLIVATKHLSPFIVNQLILTNICHLTRITREVIKSLLLQLCFRAENLTSNNDARKNECHYVTNVLKENNYPKSFLYYCLRHPTLTDCNSPEGDSAVKGFAIVPYIKGIAEPMVSRLPWNRFRH